jgi:deoxyribose-phosphate aldolase
MWVWKSMTVRELEIAPTKAALARRLLPLIDLTSLNDTDDEAAILGLSHAARTPLGDVAAVCTWPSLVGVAAQALGGTGIAIAAVANFPSGATGEARTAAEIERAIAAGANEIDVVLPYGALLAGDRQTAEHLLRVGREACGDRALLKVILETGRLASPEAIRAASELAIEAEADFLKTSTGKTQPGATLEAARIMIEAIAAARTRGPAPGFKASGGVRTLDQAGAYLGLFEEILGAGSATAANFRIGASSLMTEVLAALA